MVGVSFIQKYLGPPMSAKVDPLVEAEKTYPKLKGLGIAKVTTPANDDPRKLEFWPADEPGDQQDHPRPKELPMGKPGVQIINPDVTPEDVAGDIVSHHLVKQDATLKSLYEKFAQTFDDPKLKARLQEDYNWSRQNEGEKRPFNDWLMTTRIPDYLRGYVFNQWPDKAKAEMYTPEQRQILDRMAGYLKGKQ